MRSVFEEEEEDVEQHESHAADYGDSRGDDREVTISSTTLLMIFFGLVLICALFFGLGYTLGRRSPSETNPLQKSEAATLPASLQSNGVSKPSAAAQPSAAQPQSVSASAPELNSGPNSDPSGDPSRPETATPKPAIPPAPEAAATPAPHQVKAALPTAPATPAPEPASAITGTMVQIAAISNPADADVLVRALQKHGYSVTIRHSATDTLLHVQVGPFANRADAIGMRQKLLADGYNAILK